MSNSVTLTVIFVSLGLAAVTGAALVMAWFDEKKMEREMKEAQKALENAIVAEHSRAQTRIDNLTDIQVASELDKLRGPE